MIDYVIDYVNDAIVALRKESVDRNIFTHPLVLTLQKSLSARRAWIEINWQAVQSTINVQSLSARRAWIEMHEFASNGWR